MLVASLSSHCLLGHGVSLLQSVMITTGSTNAVGARTRCLHPLTQMVLQVQAAAPTLLMAESALTGPGLPSEYQLPRPFQNRYDTVSFLQLTRLVAPKSRGGGLGVYMHQ